MAQLIGLARIGRNAETRFTAGGDAVTELSLAFSYGKKDPNANQKPTQWVKGSLWGKRGESLAPHLIKGTLVYVVLDDAHVETFTKSDGTPNAALAGKVSVIEFASRPAAQPERQAPPPKAAPARPATNLANIDSDVPF